MRILISIAVFTLLISGCAERTVYVSVPAPDCSVPSAPAYPQLDETRHIAEPDNIEKLLIIISDMSAYIKQLRSTIDCLQGNALKIRPENRADAKEYDNRTKSSSSVFWQRPSAENRQKEGQY